MPVLIWSLGLVGANSEPIPARQSNSSRAKWVGKTGFLRSSGVTAFVEWSSAVYSKTSEIGVSDAPTGRSDLRRLNGPNELSPAMTLAGMRRFIDSDRSPAFSLLVSHPCSYPRGRLVGTFSSVRRAGRLRIANGHAGNRVSDIHEGPLSCRGTNFTTSSTRVQARRVMSLQRPVPAFSDWNASGLDPQGVAVLTDGMSCPTLSGPHKRTPSSGVRQQAGGPMGSWHQPGTHRVPRQRRRDDPRVVPGRLVRGELPANPMPGMFDPQVLRFSQAGHCYPPRLDRTNRPLPHGSALATTGTFIGPWQQGGTPLDSSARAT